MERRLDLDLVCTAITKVLFKPVYRVQVMSSVTVCVLDGSNGPCQ